MAFTALSFVVPFLSYYVLYNLRYDVTSCTWYCNKTENHAYLWIDFANTGFRYGCQDNRLVSRPFLSKHEFLQFGHCKYFCFVLNCPVAL